MHTCARMQGEEFIVDGPVVTVQELAARLGALEEAVKHVINDIVIPGYEVLGGILIKQSRLAKIEKELERRTNSKQLTLQEATELIDELGGRRPTAILETLGYRIQWHGINPDKAMVHPKN